MIPSPRSRSVLLSIAMVAALASALMSPSAPVQAQPASSVENAKLAAAASGPPPAVWTPANRPLAKHQGTAERMLAPRDFAGYTVDLPTLRDWLKGAPAETAAKGPLTIQVPNPEGKLVSFAVDQTKVMEDGLAAKHPDIGTWAGRAVDGAASIRLDVTPLGFHASVRGDGPAWFVDPAYKGADQGPNALYISYEGQDLPAPQRKLVEPTELQKQDLGPATKVTDPSIGEGQGDLVQERMFRLALVTDDAYARYFTDSTNQEEVNRIVTAAKVTLINRVNQLYAEDLSIRMVLINDSDRTNLNTEAMMYGVDGPCGAEPCFDPVVTRCFDRALWFNYLALGMLVGAENYDIGHLAMGRGSGGLAVIGGAGYSSKGQACTGLASPVGDYFAIDYVAHEMGHQFGANHTYNGVNGGCSPYQLSTETSVEPGSGSSVMSYAGLCGADDLQPVVDSMFSQRSRDEINEYRQRDMPYEPEITDVSLSRFDGNDALTLDFGAGPSAEIRHGVNYTYEGIKAVVEAAEPSPATVDVVGYGEDTNLDHGFRLIWQMPYEIPTGTVNIVEGDFTAQLGTADEGGLADAPGTLVPTTNHTPIVTIPSAASTPVTIPKRTPFTLTGSGTDPDGDSLVYTWEQNDEGTGTALMSNNKPNGPLFRIFGSNALPNAASSSPVRSFPDSAQVLTGNTNAATGECPTTGPDALECMSEFLPTSARDMNFRLTAQDRGGADGGADGGVSHADVKVRVSNLGPFLVTSQNTATEVPRKSRGTITWTPGMDSLAKNVRISFSADGGNTFDHLLAESTPNDGSQAITWPDVDTTNGRIKVEGVDNYFYAVNDAPITTTAALPGDTEPPETSITAGPAGQSIVTTDLVYFRFASSEPGSTYECTLAGSAIPCENGALRLLRPAGGSVRLNVRAVDPAGNVDPTPATREFHVPNNDRALSPDGPWKRGWAAHSYRGTFQSVKTQGAALTLPVKNITTIQLVATRGPGFGPVRVLLDGELIRTVNTAASGLQYRRLIPVANFAEPRSGTISLVSMTGKEVRIEGLALRRR